MNYQQELKEAAKAPSDKISEYFWYDFLRTAPQESKQKHLIKQAFIRDNLDSYGEDPKENATIWIGRRWVETLDAYYCGRYETIDKKEKNRRKKILTFYRDRGIIEAVAKEVFGF